MSAANMTVAVALGRLQQQLDMIDAEDAVLSTNLRTRLDGWPRSDQAMPKDTGVCLYFMLKGKPHALPCDTYNVVEQNIAALAAHLEATRAIERYGVGTMADMFTAFEALGHGTQEHWRNVLETTGRTLAEVEVAYKRARVLAHPDRGGSSEKFTDVQRAWEQAQQELG